MTRDFLLVISLVLKACGETNAEESASLLEAPRRLAEEWIAGYEPRTFVQNHAAIDLDQAQIEDLLNQRHLDSAKTIYVQGGHSQSIAHLKLVDAPPPVKPILSETIVTGRTNAGGVVRGNLVEELTWTSSDKEVDVLVEYYTNEEQIEYVDCQVGGLVSIGSANRGGCFGDTGTIQILDLQKDVPPYHFNYTYDIRQDNFNGRTIQGFSIDAEKEMQTCENCPYADYLKFVEYYDAFDYGDEWIQAAFGGSKTNFPRGNADFGAYGRPARAEAVKTGTKFMNIWMKVIYQMEHAIYLCGLPCARRCDDTPISAWDQAVAFYAGSREGENSKEQGNLLYDLADQMCTEFRTCGENGSERVGTSFVNNQIIREFTRGQSFALGRQCDQLKLSKEIVVEYMAVPLVQATLQMAHLRNFAPASSEESLQRDEVAGASFAATVLPIVHRCNSKVAETIYNNMRLNPPGDGVVDFHQVKKAFESSYQCMGITCEAVGGVWDGSYGTAAEPCGTRNPGEVKEDKAGLVTGVVLGVVLGSLIVLFVFHRSKTGRDTSFSADRDSISDVFEAEERDLD